MHLRDVQGNFSAKQRPPLSRIWSEDHSESARAPEATAEHITILFAGHPA